MGGFVSWPGDFQHTTFFNMISRILGVTRHILGRSWCKTVLTCCVFYIGRKVSGKSLWGKSPRKSPKEKIEEKSPLANCSGKFPQEKFLGKSIGKFIGTFLGKIVGKLLRKSLGKIHREIPTKIPREILRKIPKEIPTEIPKGNQGIPQENSWEIFASFFAGWPRIF